MWSNNVIAVIAFAVLCVVFIFVMVPSEWPRNKNEGFW